MSTALQWHRVAAGILLVGMAAAGRAGPLTYDDQARLFPVVGTEARGPDGAEGDVTDDASANPDLAARARQPETVMDDDGSPTTAGKAGIDSEDLFALLRQDFALADPETGGLWGSGFGSTLDFAVPADQDFQSFDEALPTWRGAVIGVPNGKIADLASSHLDEPSSSGHGRADVRKRISIIAMLRAVFSDPATWSVLSIGVVALVWMRSKAEA